MSFGACFFEQLASLFTRAVAEIRELLGVAITHGDTTDYYAMDAMPMRTPLPRAV